MSATNRHEFKAEIKQLLDIITNSLYTSRDVFLRETISNASDALDKLRYEINKGSTVLEPEKETEIRITVDEEKNTLTITDSGIGMTEAELIENIGTIAKSGSAEFIKKAMADKDNSSSIIGRFGVGFYSVFMVASQVVISSRSFVPEQKPVVWTSDGTGTYEIHAGQADQPRGTQIAIHLKDDAKEYANVNRIKSIIKKHSNFISFPIFVQGERVNTISALWREPKFSVTKEQYNEFYKFLTYDHDNPLLSLHVSVDAPVQFSSLTFIPSHESGLLGFDKDCYGLGLYVRRVLIESQNKDLIPEYLSFVSGVVDTEDLPLSISREALQENLLIRKIAATLTKQILSRLQNMARENEEDYKKFWKAHSRIFKMGYNDYANKDTYASLLRFNSSAQENKDGLTSFDAYIAAAKEGQKEIYYISGPSREAIALNPHLEIFRQKGIEVLYLYEPIDEFALETLQKYKDFTLKAAEQADIAALDQFARVEDEQEKPEELSQDNEAMFDELLTKMKDILGEKVTEVRASKRLNQSPSCLVNPETGMSSQMQKMMQIINKDNSVPAKIFEVNKNHRLIRNLIKIFTADKHDTYIKTATEQLYESALLLDGYLADPHQMVNRINGLLEKSSGWYAEIKGF